MMSIGTVADTYCRNGQGCQYAAGVAKSTGRDNGTSVIGGSVIMQTGWLDSNGAEMQAAAEVKSRTSGV